MRSYILKEPHYSTDPVRCKIANKKRAQTNMQKYGNKSCLTLEDRSIQNKKVYYAILKAASMVQNFYTKEELIYKLNSEQFYYTKYLGKNRARTMIKDDKKLYASLIHYTQFLENLNRYKRVVFSFRVIIAGRYKFNLVDDMYCRCKKYIMFDPTTRDIRLKSYCKSEGCTLGPNSKEHFQYLYGSNWEKQYINKRVIPNQSPERKLKHQLAGRIAFQKRMTRNDTKFHAMGKNEQKLLDLQEKVDNCKIMRDFNIIGYYPDGYCKETNTIYEVYEPYHDCSTQVLKDKQRQSEIEKALNCKFVIIYDRYN